jgi:hypothetical protein
VTDAGYVLGGYSITAVAVAAYVVRLRLRTRALTGAAVEQRDERPGAGPADPPS